MLYCLCCSALLARMQCKHGQQNMQSFELQVPQQSSKGCPPVLPLLLGTLPQPHSKRMPQQHPPCSHRPSAGDQVPSAEHMLSSLPL
jgi:hypothetical protein